MILLLNLALWFDTRESLYGWFSLFVGAQLLFFFCFLGLASQHLLPQAPLLTDAATGASVLIFLAVGNAVEVTESVEVLAGGGPADVVELTLVLAREMLDLAGTDIDPATVLADGRAMDAWRRMIQAQGGDPDAALPTARESETIRADVGGVVTRTDALSIGVAAWRLGAGRARKEDPVSAGAGIMMHAKPGDVVAAGDPLLTLLTDEPLRFALAREALTGAVIVSPVGSRIDRLPLVIDRLT